MLKNKKIWLIPASVLGGIILICGIAAGFLALNKFYIDVTLNGEKDITVEYGDSYTEKGAVAKLFGRWIYKNGKDIELVTEGSVDEKTLGSYTVKYSASKNKMYGEAIRTVTVVDTKLPELTLEGESEITVTRGNSFKEPGFKASDNYDGDITDNVTVTGAVNTDKAGKYTLTYEVKDSSGNTAKAERTVTVKNPPTKPSVTVTENPTVNPGEKTVYLTFDDGPCAYTAKLLDVLAKYNVKATFFVTNNNPSYNYLFKRMADEGHAIGIHTATHDYKQIYASEEAFYNDLYKMQGVIKDQTGITTMLMRFPGGSSNLVSSFNKGIMTRLSQSVTQKGFRYFDWNVTSGDAGETTSTSKVAQNVINGMASHGVSVVLQHDIKNFSVNAVEQIIQWGLANGYTFKACDMTSPTCHHGINN